MGDAGPDRYTFSAEVIAVAGAYILVSVEAGKAREVLDTIRALDGARQAHTCWGQPDIFAYFEVPDDRHLAEIVLEQIQNMPGVRTTETHLVVDL
jgi:DNA-binding Lrp family transcriptional regulator